MRFLNNDSLFGRFFNQLGDIILLNVLFLVCSIPIITIGASYTAIYYSFLTRLHKNDEAVYKTFFKSFKENLKKSTLTWLLAIVVAIILGADIMLFSSKGKMPNTSMFYLFIILSVIFSIWLMFVFPVIASFENTLKNLYFQAFFLAAKNVLFSLLIAFISIVPFVICLESAKIFLATSILWILCGFSLIAYANSFIFYHIFSPYLDN